MWLLQNKTLGHLTFALKKYYMVIEYHGISDFSLIFGSNVGKWDFVQEKIVFFPKKSKRYLKYIGTILKTFSTIYNILPFCQKINTGPILGITF